MEIRDVIHGSIVIEKNEFPIISSRYFERLRHIKQLGFAEHSFPSATHNRLTHCLGTLETATQAFDTVFAGPHARAPQFTSDRLLLAQQAPNAYNRFRAVLRLAALLHDIGHGPLSHTTEFAMPEIGTLGFSGKPRKANHEDYTLKIILDSGLTPLLDKAGTHHGFSAKHVASLVDRSMPANDDFFFEYIDNQKINFRPILQQLISSELDADRMDYLRRDSLQTGVSYGEFDFDWLIANLTSYIRDGQCLMALQHRALYSFEDFLLSRFHMFLMVYFHYKSVVFDEMLAQYFESEDCDYTLPSDIEKYCDCTDTHLYSHLEKTTNKWAKRITEKNPYKMLLELHSGIPATKTAATEQQELLSKIQSEMESKKIHCLMVTSTSELSKYFRKPADTIFIRYDNHYSPVSYIPLEKCTDLFQKYSEKRSIVRLYVSPENYDECCSKDLRTPLKYE